MVRLVQGRLKHEIVRDAIDHHPPLAENHDLAFDDFHRDQFTVQFRHSAARFRMIFYH